jgi:hypothetical protein
MPDTATKRCPKCEQVKPLDDFYRQTRSRYGRQSWCKVCRSDQMRKKRVEQPEMMRAASRRYQAAHGDVIRERWRLHREANLEAEREREHLYYLASQEAIRERNRRLYEGLRAQVLAHYGEACTCCGSTEKLSIDHVRSIGGHNRKNSTASRGAKLYRQLIKQGFPGGYQTLCTRCNSSKGRGERCILDHTEGLSNLGSYLTRDAILRADNLKTEEVHVPEWSDPASGSDVVLVRELRGRERDEWEASLAVQRGRQMVPDVANMRAKLAARCIIDPDSREPLFTQQDVAALGELSAAALDRVFEVASRLSGLGDSAVEEKAKNSATVL